MARLLIHEGGILNASVYRIDGPDGPEFVEKDFSTAPWLVRNTVGRFLAWREEAILRRLERSTDAVPRGARRVSPFCLREEFVSGETIRDRSDRAGREGIDRRSGRLFGREFMDALERKVRDVHRARFVHLDLHNARNVIVGPGENPVIVDWQSAVSTALMPPPLRRALEKIDLMGVLKFREKFRPGDLTPQERLSLDRSRFLRRHFWVPRFHR